MWKKIVLWVLAVVLTIAAAIYQRTTGPTYPKRVEMSINGQDYKLKLLRSHGGPGNAGIEVAIADTAVSGTIHFKRYPTNEAWQSRKLVRRNGVLVGELPHQPLAGKLAYYIELQSGSETVALLKREEPAIIRFKGDVPAWTLIPHILLMFSAMLFSNVAGFFAAFKISNYKLYTTLAFVLILVGGMLLGPVVQKFAFDEWWAGVPFAWDLTDNKTLIAFIFWIAAVVGNRKKQRYWLTILAAVVTLIIFSIPHSMFGSELDPETGEIIQGAVRLYRFGL